MEKDQTSKLRKVCKWNSLAWLLKEELGPGSRSVIYRVRPHLAVLYLDHAKLGTRQARLNGDYIWLITRFTMMKTSKKKKKKQAFCLSTKSWPDQKSFPRSLNAFTGAPSPRARGKCPRFCRCSLSVGAGDLSPLLDCSLFACVGALIRPRPP